MKKKGIYQFKSSKKESKEYTVSVLTENKAGLLNHITIIFNRRKMNIDSLNVSSTEVKGVSRFTIVVNSSKEKIIKVVEDVMTKFNKEIAIALEKKICKAKSITIKENIAIYVHQKNKELGYVGTPTRIDDKLIKNFIHKDFVPIIAPMGLDEKMQVYNINADTVAGALAISLKSRNSAKERFKATYKKKRNSF